MFKPHWHREPRVYLSGLSTPKRHRDYARDLRILSIQTRTEFLLMLASHLLALMTAPMISENATIAQNITSAHIAIVKRMLGRFMCPCPDSRRSAV